ncbi:MAG: salicylate hydroxylase [Paracoccaceae bacterium]|jgi:salicylate hydroxylase
MAVKGKSITILGAGIGGLTAAIALARRGARVSVVDQAPELGEVGAGLQLTPNGTAVLDALDMGEQVRAIGQILKAVELKDYRGGDPVVRLDMTQANHSNPNPYLLLHRADLIEMLAHEAERLGVSLIFGKQVSGVAIGFDQATLPIEDGTQRMCKILIGADGIRSLTRQALNVKTKSVFTGHVAWRATVRADFLPLYDVPAVATVYMAPKRHLVTYPVRGGSLINIVAVQERKDWVKEGWNHQDDPDNLRAAFADFNPEVKRLLSVVDQVHLWGLFAHSVAENWYQSGTAIMGDAAHPTLPYLAQGANMALEDAWVLAEEMDRIDNLQDAFEVYQDRREARVKRIVKAADSNTGIYHMGAPMRAMLHKGMRVANAISPERMLGRFDWLYGVDVTKGD